jgi:hypothetical protein
MINPLAKLLTATLLSILGLSGLTQAHELSKQQRAEIRRFASNNSLFVLYHEVGHLLFDQLELPVLGREEDAADNVATWILLNKRTKQAERTLADAAQGWVLSGIAYDSGGDESDYAAGHSLDKQRAYQIVCLMVGMDSDTFHPIADEYRMDSTRQDSCNWDYSMINRSLLGLLSREQGSGGGTQVNVTYHEPSEDLAAAADAFKSSGVFDEVADEVRQKYNIRTPVAFNAQTCGEANAFYDPETVEVIFCYELMQDYMDLYTNSLGTSDEAVLEQVGLGKTKKNKL